MIAQNSTGLVCLTIKAPRSVDNSLDNFTAFFGDLHKFIKGKPGLTESEQTISFEVILKENYFHYNIIVSDKISSVIKSLLYTKFPNIEIGQSPHSIKDLSKFQKAIELRLKRFNYFPLKTQFTASDDPYVTLSSVLTKLEHFQEGAVIELLLRPMPDPWIKKFLREKFYFILGSINRILLFLEKPFLERDFVNYYEELKNKFASSHFMANVRVLTYAKDLKEVQEDFDLILKSLEKLDNGDINSLTAAKISQSEVIDNYIHHRLSKKHSIFNTREAAAIFRFPDTSLKISSVHKVSTKKVAPPKNLPIASIWEKPSISTFGITDFRDENHEFGVRREDRNRHLYIVGKTGMGKSKLIELLALSDILDNKGFCVIDPHGDLAVNILKYIPKEKVKDVIYFNPTDISHPIGFNPLECHNPESKHQVVTGFIAIFKKLFSANWTSRLEHMLRFTVLALIEAGDTTVVDIVGLLTNVEFRQNVISKIKDPVVKNFWTHEFASWNERFDNEAIIPIINQVGQFISNDYIRSVVSQKHSAIDFYRAMNEGKIIIINIAKGKLGEDNSALLGSMIITKIQEAIMARVDLPEDKRKEFYLYVDEFQNFATDSFNEILSEARKFNLSITIAHQFIDQLPEKIRKTVFGNIGSFICFRVGPEDALFLKREFAPDITPGDLVNADFRNIYVKISIDGKTSHPFSAVTIDTPGMKTDFSQDIINWSRKTYAARKTEVDKKLIEDQQVSQLIIDQDSVTKENEVVFEEPII